MSTLKDIINQLLKCHSVPGVPVEGSIEFEMDNESSFGAVLTTEAPVIRESYPRQEDPWKRWMKANSKALMQSYNAENPQV